MVTKIDMMERPVAVVGMGSTLTSRILRRLIEHPVVELRPSQAVMTGCDRSYRAVIVENFDPGEGKGLTPCGVARWELARCTDVTVVSLDEPEGRRMAAQSGERVYSYSDGRPQADLTAKNVRLNEERLEFEALTDRTLLRVRIPLLYGPCLYDYLAALAGALAVGVPLETAVGRLATSL